jgi:cysteinyl-tRNA synthetase
MKKYLVILVSFGILFQGCKKNNIPDNINFKQEMRNFVQNLGTYARSVDSMFIVIPQNGEQLASETGEPGGSPATEYLASIDGQGREDLFYGYNGDDDATPLEDKDYMMSFLNIEEQNGLQVLVTDYCSTHSKMDNSYAQNKALGFISFAASERNLNVIPDYPLVPYNQNTNDIDSLSQAMNFLYLINPENYTSRQDFINAVSQTNYDLVLMDLFFNDDAFTATEIETLKTKNNGGKRLVICYMSIGEAEDYRWYWKTEWKRDQPVWLDRENPNWKGNYKVWYWEKEWQDIIYGNDDSYLKKILNAGFDGAYLDIIDAFEYYEGN